MTAARRPAPAAPPGVPVSRFLFRSQPDAIRRVVVGVMGSLAHVQLNEDARDSLELVLAEVLNNAAEHACRGRPDMVIELTVALVGDEVRCVIADDGLPMPGGEAPPGVLPDPQDLAEGGYGWFLIRELTRDLSYCREGSRNLTRFAVPIHPS